MIVYVNTRNRITKQYSYDRLVEVPALNPIIVCPKNEVQQHMDLGRRAMGRPDACANLSDTRQWLLDICPDKIMVFVDDDLEFFIRKNKEDFHLRKCNAGDLRELFKRINRYITHDNIKHVGLDMRQGNNNHEIPYKEVGRACSFLAYDVEFLRKNDIRFDNLPLMQDFDVCLTLLEMGYPNRIITEFCFNERGGSNAKGGVSDYRNQAMLANVAHALAMRHAPFVKVVTKKAKTGWKGMQERTDVNIQWLKAYASSKQKGFF